MEPDLNHIANMISDIQNSHENIRKSREEVKRMEQDLENEREYLEDEEQSVKVLKDQLDDYIQQFTDGETAQVNKGYAF